MLSDDKKICSSYSERITAANIIDVVMLPQQLPGRRPTETDYQGVVSISGNIWETFRVYSARSASMSQYPQFY